MSRKSALYIVFGAGDIHNKAVIIGPSGRLSGYECNIVSLKDGSNYAAGETIDTADIDGLYTTLYFTKLESLRAFSNALNEVVKRWEDEENGTYDTGT